VLLVHPDAPLEIIRSSYRTLMQSLRVHPDLGGDTRQAALVNEAYAVLIDPARRAEYDRLRRRFSISFREITLIFSFQSAYSPYSFEN
jgi:curved DNA-binding protein CbpA